MPGRSSKPLIEMMTGRRPSGSASPAPSPAPRLSPPSQKRPSTPAQTASSPEEHATYTVRLTSIYLGGAILLTLGVLLYAGGYKIGWNAGQDQFASSLGASVDDHLEPIRDPINDPEIVLGDPIAAVRTEPQAPQGIAPHHLRETEQALREPQIQSVPPGKSVLDVGSGPIITSAGMVQADPRTPGVNYVQLVDLPRDQAVAAVEYLAAHNERVIAVPLERRAREPNNPWYRLFSLEVPVPSEQFAAMGRDRRDHIRRVAQIGQRWRREERGGSDFSTAFYSKYTP